MPGEYVSREIGYLSCKSREKCVKKGVYLADEGWMKWISRDGTCKIHDIELRRGFYLAKLYEEASELREEGY